MEKYNAKDLLKNYSTVLIRAAKLIDERIINIEALERWHRLKVYGMPFIYYLGERKIELLC